MSTGMEQRTRSPPPTEREVQLKPWQFIGYPGYSRFIASDDDFYVLRRFDVLSARVALALQDEISALEERLSELDKRFSSRREQDLNNGTFRHDVDDRVQLVATVGEKLQRYHKFILQQSKLKHFEAAPDRSIKKIKSWHYNHDRRAISSSEQLYLSHLSDLISVVQKERTPLRKLIDSSRLLRTLGLFKETKKNGASHAPPINGRSQSTQETRAYESGNFVSYYSDKRVDLVVSILIATVGVAMLITPIWHKQGD